ncbi:hypothetical protein B0J13DRAFT_531292 [Dactylonectria estremocensis]|uniref:Uncharacterized protein n=1 Tax=Dactylonectria estremocensis TaxID=1079267 RepID=A0A9P9DTK0_9HYPO|nr:hypothetical protein B0J13DRAFT_531292 [Dactylonectria estremocensis]
MLKLLLSALTAYNALTAYYESVAAEESLQVEAEKSYRYPRIQAAIRKLKYALKPLSEAAELTALRRDLESDASLSSTSLSHFNDEDNNNENSFEPENDIYDGGKSGDDDNIEIITEIQELQLWERSSPPVTETEEVDDEQETPCPPRYIKPHQSTYKHIKKDLETFRDRLRKHNRFHGHDTI